MTIKKSLLFLGLAIIVVVAVFAVMNIPTVYFSSSGSSVPQLGMPGRSGLSAPSFDSGADFGYSETKSGGNIAVSPKTPRESSTQREVIKTGQLSLFVKDAEKTASDMAGVASHLGGFVANSQVYEVSKGLKAGTVTIRVPAGKFDEAMLELKKLAVEVERESINSDDVTEQAVDLEARLRNYRKTEEQYLTIMEQAKNVNETLQISQQLSNIRGQIEQTEASLQYLSRQVDLATITASLTAEADVEVFGVRWRPLITAKQSLRAMFEGLRGYTDAMIWFFFSLPVIILWVFTLLLFGLIAWKIIRWVGSKFIGEKPHSSISNDATVANQSPRTIK